MSKQKDVDVEPGQTLWELFKGWEMIPFFCRINGDVDSAHAPKWPEYVPVEHEGDDRSHHHGQGGDEETLAELLQVLPERKVPLP